MALGLSAPARAGERALAPPGLAGFTPTLQVSLVLRDPHFWVNRETTMSAMVSLQGLTCPAKRQNASSAPCRSGTRAGNTTTSSHTPHAQGVTDHKSLAPV